MKILLATEDSYPFYTDDVASWCDTLTKELSEVEFTVLSVTTPTADISCQPSDSTFRRTCRR